MEWSSIFHLFVSRIHIRPMAFHGIKREQPWTALFLLFHSYFSQQSEREREKERKTSRKHDNNGYSSVKLFPTYFACHICYCEFVYRIKRQTAASMHFCAFDRNYKRNDFEAFICVSAATLCASLYRQSKRQSWNPGSLIYKSNKLVTAAYMKSIVECSLMWRYMRLILLFPENGYN